MSHRIVVRISGESGSGIDSAGHIIMHSLKQSGYYVVADREYPSLIKGGCANYQINISSKPIYGQSMINDIGIGTDRIGTLDCIQKIKSGGIVLCGYEKIIDTNPESLRLAESRQITLIHIPALQLASIHGGGIMFTNTVMIGALRALLGGSYEILKQEMIHKFGKKKTLLDINLACLQSGYNLINDFDKGQIISYHLQTTVGVPDMSTSDQMLIEGNTALALGAIHAGVRAYYAYPMSPSSSILSYLAKVAPQTGMLVKQVEDEISVINMTLGSMYAGTRALCATSGGGFDLMIETISLSAMIEVPLVVIVAQRPGPATGLPTRTAQADLNLAVYAGHGEFGKCVIAVGDPKSAFDLIQHAYNIAETYHIPVIILTEKTIAETYQVCPLFTQEEIVICRGLVTDPVMLESLKPEHRFALTDTGVSFRRIPGSSQTISYTNGDEHHPDGTLDESIEVDKMVDKRIKKNQNLMIQIPQPHLYGDPDAMVTIVGRGSTINPLRDVLIVYYDQDIAINYLHYEYMRPLQTDLLQGLIDRGNQMIIIEGNAYGQLANLIRQQTGYHFAHQLLKYNGRPRYIQEIIQQLDTIIKKNKKDSTN